MNPVIYAVVDINEPDAKKRQLPVSGTDNGDGTCSLDTTGGGGGGGADSTAANQVLQLTQETAINSKLPASLGTKTSAASLAVVLASDQSRILTDTLGRPGVSRQLAVIATSASIDLTSGVTRISMIARGADIRYRVATVAGGALTAVITTDHLIIQNERLDLNVQSVGRIAAIRDGAVSGVLEITELL